MYKHLFALIGIISTTISFTQTTVSGSFEFDGEAREYRIYIPAIYNESQPTPLVFNLHGYGSSNVEQEFYGDFRPIADTANFIIVHPQGLLDDFGGTHWNTFGTTDVDDVGFLAALIDTVSFHYNINSDRIYSTGMSNGGFMSYKLACQLSSEITAIASVTGTISVADLPDCNANHPTPIMQIHGTEDDLVPYEGNAAFVGMEDLVEYWVDFNGCSSDPIITEMPDIDPEDGCTATHYLYEDGLLGSTVEFFKINDGEHTWPGASIDVGITNQDIDASVEIWRFFSQYTLSHLKSSVEENVIKGDFDVYPNPTNTDQINLTFIDQSIRTIKIFNGLGQLIQTLETSTAKVLLVLPESGFYFVECTTGDQTITKKVVRN